MDSTRISFLVFGLLCTAFFLKTIHSWFKDYQFYKVNNWDYSKDSGRELSNGVAMHRSARMSNKEKMQGGYVRGAIITFLLAFFSWIPFFIG
jgi:hypothetical protein